MSPARRVVVIDRPNRDVTIDPETTFGPGVELIELQGAEDPGLVDACRSADAIAVDLAPVGADLIAQMQRCRVIAEYGVGVNNIDVEAATRQGIYVSAVPWYCVGELADHAFALILSLTRGIVPLSRQTAHGGWDHAGAGVLRRMAGATLGVVGYGKVGQGVAHRARAFGLNVLVHDPFVTDIAEPGTRPAGLDEIFSTADVVTLHCPLTPESYHLVDAARLASMKPTAFLVNTARGGLVDQEALTHALAAGQIAGAALDVLDAEPPPFDLPLLSLPNVIVTPHAGFYSGESIAELHAAVMADLAAALQGKAPRCPVNHLPQTLT